MSGVSGGQAALSTRTNRLGQSRLSPSIAKLRWKRKRPNMSCAADVIVRSAAVDAEHCIPHVSSLNRVRLVGAYAFGCVSAASSNRNIYTTRGKA